MRSIDSTVLVPQLRRLVPAFALLIVFAVPGASAQEAPSPASAEQKQTEKAPPPAAVVYKAPKVDAEGLKTILESGQDFYVLDVRRPEELEEKGTLEGYVNIPLESLEERIAEIPKDAKILSLCNTGNRSGKAAVILEKHGLNVRAVGGLKEWGEKGWPLIYPAAPAPKPEEKPAGSSGTEKKSGF